MATEQQLNLVAEAVYRQEQTAERQERNIDRLIGIVETLIQQN